MTQTNIVKIFNKKNKSKNDNRLIERWSFDKAQYIFNLPLNDLLFKAQSIHRENFDHNKVQISQLISIKTGGCTEDCGYCNQSSHHKTELKASKLMEIQKVIKQAKQAKESGSTRYCMGAAWRSPKSRDIETLLAMVSGVKELGMETCMTLGMLSDNEANQFKNAGLDYYNHNIDTSEEYYQNVVSTHSFSERLDTLENIRNSGMKICSGGIVGMGETQKDRVNMLVTLANLPEPPESVPINMLIPIKGTPLGNVEPIDSIEFIRTIATARILMPKSYVRLSAGRSNMTDEMQAMCFFAGANSIFVGEKLLTTNNPSKDKDTILFSKLGIQPEII